MSTLQQSANPEACSFSIKSSTGIKLLHKIALLELTGIVDGVNDAANTFLMGRSVSCFWFPQCMSYKTGQHNGIDKQGQQDMTKDKTGIGYINIGRNIEVTKQTAINIG